MKFAFFCVKFYCLKIYMLPLCKTHITTPVSIIFQQQIETKNELFCVEIALFVLFEQKIEFFLLLGLICVALLKHMANII